MRIRVRNEFWAISALYAFLFLLFTLAQPSPVRLILGVLTSMFFPGYALIAALFPKKDGPGWGERALLSIGTNIVITPGIGLLWTYSPGGFSATRVLASLFLWVVLLSAVAWWRRRRLPEAERFVPLDIQLRGLDWKRQGAVDRAFTILLPFSVLLAAASAVYVISNPLVGERYTELYYLGEEGMAAGYPREVALGQEAGVWLGITNWEQRPMTYRVAVAPEGAEPKETGLVVLENGEQWKGWVTFAFPNPGDGQRVWFNLYRAGQKSPYRQLYLVLDVPPYSKFDYLELEWTELLPKRLAWEQAGNITPRIVNREGRAVNYRLEIRIEVPERAEKEVVVPREFTLAPGEEWRQLLGFAFAKPGKQQVELWLYREGQPYKKLQLWADILPSEG